MVHFFGALSQPQPCVLARLGVFNKPRNADEICIDVHSCFWVYFHAYWTSVGHESLSPCHSAGPPPVSNASLDTERWHAASATAALKPELHAADWRRAANRSGV